MQASGLCHTDIHAAHGDWPVKPTPPFVPGHEGVGAVHAVGLGVTGFSVGDTVAYPWLGYACGKCKHCLTGWETLCLRQQNTGYSIDGCYAEYISGIGGLGHLALQYAKIFGGTVAAIDVTDEKLQLAKDLGADIVIDARTEDPAAVLQAHGGADVAIGLAVDDKSFATAYAGLRRGGRLVLVALPAAGTLSIPVFDTVLNGTSVIGSIVGTRADLADVFALHALGRTKVIYEIRDLGSVNESIDDVLHGKAKARIVLQP